MKKRIHTVAVLIVALALIFGGSLAARLVHTSGEMVTVTRIAFDTKIGRLSGLLYVPKKNETVPRPTVITTHGYLNSAEMQDANAIELSRRGYVVLALDMYDHGHSKVKAENYSNTQFFGLWSTFWINSIYDAVQYMYEQPYVLKDAAGNGIIGVSGHSMGGFSSTVALARDEQDFVQSGIRKIACSVTEGSDFYYSGFVGVDAKTAAASGGGRTMGKVAARYDEFFFNMPDAPAGTVRKKDYTATPDAKTWLERENPLPDTWYETTDGGMRIIYEPAETHPWNHFSITTTAHVIDFYTTAFKNYQTEIRSVDANRQIWYWKEIFECIALAGFVLMLVPLAMLIMRLPFFRFAKTPALKPLPSAENRYEKAGKFALLLTIILVPAIFFTTLWDANRSSDSMQIFFAGALICALSGFAALVSGITEKQRDTRFITGAAITLAGGTLLALSVKIPMYKNLTFWTAPTVNNIAYWTITCALITLSVLGFTYTVSGSKRGLSFMHYGITFRPLTVAAAFATALVTAALAYIVVFLIDFIFHTDFRIWTFAFKTFDADIFPAVLRYLPTFFAYYLMSTIGICINTNTEKMQGIKGYFLAIALNAGGILLWLIQQYGTLFLTDTAAHPSASLSGIVLIAMTLTLAIAACLSRALYKRTGNVWVPAFLNALLVTVMTLANTTVYFKQPF